MSDKTEYITEEYNGIKVKYSTGSRGTETLEVFYLNESIYFYTISGEYQDKILMNTRSLSIEEKYQYWQNFHENAQEYMSKLKAHKLKKDKSLDNIVELLGVFVFPKIVRILFDDFNKSRSITSFESNQTKNDKPIMNNANFVETPENSQTISDKQIVKNAYTLETPEEIEKEIEKTLRILLLKGFIIKAPNDEKNIKYWQNKPLNQIISKLKTLKQSGDIIIPEIDDIEYFIKKNIYNQTGNPIESNFRVVRHREKKKNSKF
jgi:hypothetical protein